MALSDEARRRYKAVWEAVIVAQERDPQERGPFPGQDVLSKRRINGAGVTPQDVLTGRSTNSHHAGSAVQELSSERRASGTKGSAQQAAFSERRLNDGSSAPQVRRSESGEATTTEGMACRPVSSVAARSTVDTVATERQCGRGGQACLVKPRATGQRSAASRPGQLKPEVAGVRSVGGTLANYEDWRDEVRWRVFCAAIALNQILTVELRAVATSSVHDLLHTT